MTLGLLIFAFWKDILVNFWVKICDQFFLKKWACDQFFLGFDKKI